jgi:hypothetical protein
VSQRQKSAFCVDIRGSSGSAYASGRRLVIADGIMKGMDEGLTAGEWEQFITLLQRFAEHDLDQHDAWQVDTSFGPVFVRISREPRPDEPAEAFRHLARPVI